MSRAFDMNVGEVSPDIQNRSSDSTSLKLTDLKKGDIMHHLIDAKEPHRKNS